jgi:hypothetical protein
MRLATTNLGRGLLGLALLAFLLPFATVGCGAPRGYGSIGEGVTAEYRGATLALGGAPELRGPDGSPASTSALTAEDLSPPQPLVTLALAMTIASFVRSLTGARRRAAWVAGLAAGAAALTAVAQLEFNRAWTGKIVAKLQAVQPAALANADPNLFVSTGIGFWVLLLLLGLAAVLNRVLALTDRRAGPREAESERSAPLAA